MASKRAPPGAAPISQEAVAIVKKKLAAPKGPPPAGLANFKPKTSVPNPAPYSSYPDEEKPSSYVSERERRRDERDERDGGRDRESERERDNHRDRDRDDRDETQYTYEDDDRSDSQSQHSDDDASPEPRHHPSANRDTRDARDLEDARAARDSSSHHPPSKPSRTGATDDAARAPPSIFSSVLQAAKATTAAESKSGGAGLKLLGSAATVSQPTQLIPGSLLPQCIDGTKKPTIFNFSPILKVTYRELRAFVLSSAQPGVVVRCYIERDRAGMNVFSPVYSLCADLEDGTGRELLACRKVLQSRSSHYVFSLKVRPHVLGYAHVN